MDKKSVRVPVSSAYYWLDEAWRVTLRNYPLCLGWGLLSLILTYGLGLIPNVGEYLGTVVMTLLAPGFLVVSKKIMKNQKPKFTDVFLIFDDSKLFYRVLPFLIFGIVVGVLSKLLIIYFGLITEGADMNAKYFLALFVTLLPLIFVTILTYLSMPLMVFEGATFAASLSPSAKAVMKNAFTLFLFMILWLSVLVVSGMLMGIPLIFIFSPMGVVLPYIIYRRIFNVSAD